MIDGTSQRLPVQRGIHAIQLRPIRAARFVMTTRVGEAQINISIVGEVFVTAQVADQAEFPPLVRLKDIARVAPEDLRCRLQENVLRGRQDAGYGYAGIINPVFAPYE